MNKKQIIDPLVISFDRPEEVNSDLSSQCIALVNSHAHLILGFPKGTIPPNFGAEFSTPKFIMDRDMENFHKQRSVAEKSGDDPDETIRVVSRDELDTGSHPNIMYFYDKKLLYWHSTKEEGRYSQLFVPLNRAGRRIEEAKVRVPLLPLGVTITRSTPLINRYNQRVRMYLEGVEKGLS